MTNNYGGWLEIVGIVPNTMSDDLRKMSYPEPEIIELSTVPSEGPWVLVRTASDPLPLIDSLRLSVLAVDKDTPVANMQILERVIPESMDEQRSLARLLIAFAGMALVLAAVGLYGVMAYSVTQQTKEIGIRIALGAQGRDVLKQVVGHALKVILLGVVVGLAGAWALTRLLTHQLYGVTATDPETFAGVSILLGGVALVAGYIPARRAMKVDPMVALRYE